MESDRPKFSPASIWWREVCAHRSIYIAGLMAMLVTNGTEVLAPKALQWMIDSLFSLANSAGEQLSLDAFNGVLKSSAIFIAIAFVGLFGRVFWRFTLARMTHVAGISMKCQIWDALRSTSLENVSRFTLGDLMNRAIGDVNSARWIYGFTMVLTCDIVFFTGLGAVSMILIHPGIALACLSTFLIFPLVVIRLAKREYKAHEAAQLELTTLSELVSQALRGVRAQRASDSFGSWLESLDRSAARYADLRLRAQKIAINSFPLCSLPTIVSYLLLFMWGPKLVISGEITVGEFAALASYVYLLQGPIAEVGGLVAEWQRGFASVNRIAEITRLSSQHNDYFDRQPATQTDQVNENGRVELACGSISEFMPQIVLEVEGLAAMRGGKFLFRDVNFKQQKGEWIGLCGDVGCGKSTLLQLISGLRPTNSGTLRLKGIQIGPDRSREIISASRQDIAYAPEKPFVFAGTVRHNLALGQTYRDSELWEALELVCMAQDIRQMPGGLDGIVGEGGVSLSGGQRQRLALARVILRASVLVVLDDPLSAVDIETERKIIGNLQGHWIQHSVIWASSKITTLNCCHRIARLTPNGLEFDANLQLNFSDKMHEVYHA